MTRVLLACVLLCAGCCAPRAHELAITWTSDGNPLALPCGAVAADCKAGIEVRDQTAGVTHPLPIAATGYLAVDATHAWAVRVVGFDANGEPLDSEWESPQP